MANVRFENDFSKKTRLFLPFPDVAKLPVFKQEKPLLESPCYMRKITPKYLLLLVMKFPE